MDKNKISRISKKSMVFSAAVASIGGAAIVDFSRAENTAHAATITFDTSPSNIFTVNGSQDYAFLYVDGELAFCIEPYSYVSNGTFRSLSPSHSRLDSRTLREIEQIAYWGYYNTSQSKSDYVTAQAMIWERMQGGSFDASASVPDYSSRKDAINSKIQAYKRGFSHDGETHKVILGDTLNLTDANGWLSLVDAVPSQTPGWNLSVSGNTFSASPTSDAEDAKVYLNSPSLKRYSGTSIVYSSDETVTHGVTGQPADLQDLAVLKVFDSDPGVINLKPIKFMSIHTEKSVSAINRLITDEEYRAATDGQGDLSATTYALYKDGQPVRWSDNASVRPETQISKGSRVEGDEVKVRADGSGEVQIDNLIRKGNYELREIEGPYDTTMDTSPSVTFSDAEANAIGGRSPLVSKVNDEENKSTNNANGVVNALKPRMHIATEKSISSYGRMITDAEAKSHGADVAQAVFELYKDGQPVRWSDNTVVDARSNVTLGTKVEGSDTVKIKADEDGKVGIEKIFEGDYELREVTAPDQTRMDLTPTVKFTAAEARKKAIETDTVQNVKIEKFNDEDRPDSTASAEGVVNTLIQRAEVKTEKSISAINRLITDAEARDKAETNVNQTIFELYKNGTAVKWSDNKTVDDRTSITTGTKVDGDTVKVQADDNGEVSIKGVIIDANDTDVFTWKEVRNPEDTLVSEHSEVSITAAEVKEKALAENVIQNAKVEKLNNEENKSTNNANGVVNALKPRMHIATEKSISSYGRMITDAEAKSHGADVAQAVFELYKDGQPVRWSDNTVVDARSNVTLGTKVEGSDTVKIKADEDGKVGIEKIFEGDYELREVTAPDQTRMDLTPTVKFTAAEARKKAIETDTVQNVKIEKFNDEDRPDSTASAEGVVNTLIQRAEVKTEKSISANGRLLTDDEAKEVSTDVHQTIFELYKNGKAVEWSDKSTVDDRTSITTGTKVEASTVKVQADEHGEVSIKGVIIDANDTDVFTWKEVHNPEDTYLSQRDHVDFSAEEVKAKALAENIIQNAKIEKLNNEENRSTENAKGVVNALHEFELEVQKTFTMTGTTREGMTSTVGTDEKFSAAAYSELLKIGKFKYSDVQVELRYSDGTPVKWSDTAMYFYRKNEIKNPVKGTFVSRDGNVRLTPDNDGKIVFDHLVTDGRGYKLAEVQTSNRTSLDDTSFDIDGDTQTDNNVTTKTQFYNNVDYTGIKLTKEINYLDTKDTDTRGNAKLGGAEYTLYYGDGDKKDQPVKVGDAVIDKLKMSADTSVSKSGNIVFTTNDAGIVANIDNLVYGSYYLQETKAAPGLHLDKNRHYFGDKVEMPEGSIYHEATTHHESDTQKSTSIESEGKTYDNIKLISTELEKRIKHIGTSSPFQTATRTAWGQQGSPITYAFADTMVDYYSKAFGASKTEGNEYTLYYKTNTLDGKGKQDQPVKWTDEVVQHMKVTKGIKVAGDNVTISTDADGKISAENIAYGSFYWKETKTNDGLAKDLKEYTFGFQSVNEPTYVQDDKLKSKINEPENQTNTNVSQNDDLTNYRFDNTFGKGRFGSTDTILTFGFSGEKIAKFLEDKVSNDGENGVKLKLTPINGTIGKEIETTTARSYTTDNSGKVIAKDGYFEFRTIPFGQYRMTSDGSHADTADNTLAKLLDMQPIIITMSRDDDDENYKLTMHLDVNNDGNLDKDDLLLNTWTSKNGDLPTQSQLNAVLGKDNVWSGYGEGKNGADVTEGDDYVWTRSNNVDVNSDGSKNKNFISGEIFVGGTGFTIVDAPEEKPALPEVKIGTQATDASDGDKIINSNDESVEIADKVLFTVKGKGMKEGETYTLRAQAVDTKTGEKVGEPVYHTFEYKGQESETLKVKIDTTDKNEHSYTMFEALYEGEVNKENEKDKTPKALHEDINSSEQTVKTDKSSVSIGTTATDKADGDKVVQANSKQSIVDKISLKVEGRGLIDGKEYTAEAQLVKKSDQSSAAETVYHTFTYKKGMESVDVEIPVDTAGLHNQDVVVFETLYKGKVDKDSEPNNRKVVAEHKDIKDEGQTVKVKHDGEIKTKATDTVDGDKLVAADTSISITDEIDLTKANLNDGETYPVTAMPVIPYTDAMENQFKGKEPIKFEDLKSYEIKEPTLVLDKNNQKAVALPYKSVKVVDENGKATENNTFVYKNGMKSVKVVIDGVDTSELGANKKIVMFEAIKSETIKPLLHADINDEDQTVKTEAKMKTTFFAVGGSKDAYIENKNFNKGAYTVAYDEVTVYGTDPNRSANVTLTLMTPTKDAELDKKDGKEDGMTFYLDANGQKVTRAVQVTPTKGNMKFKIWLEFEANDNDDQIVAYETATWQGEEKPFTSHEDPKSSEQTIRSIKPDITTKAHDKENDQMLERGEKVKAYDETEASNLIKGQRYIVKAQLMKIIEKDGAKSINPIYETTKEFVAESSTWKHRFETEVNTTNDDETVRYVWYEWLYDGVVQTDKDREDKLAEHNDPMNKSQTLRVEPKSETPLKKYASTGEETIGWLSGLGAAILAAMFGREYVQRRRKETDKGE